jgi:D-glycero-alpha-D-manno-heptose-7-phosphate kinase
MVQEAQSVLCSGRDIAEVGRLLHESWIVKRQLTSKIAPPAVDQIYATARSAGAIGGKLMGAGGGGFMVLFVRPADQGRVRTALRGLLEVPFRFDRSGSEVIVYQPDPATRRSTGDR